MSNLLEGIDFSALKEVEQNQEAAKTQAIPAGEVEIPIDDIIPDPVWTVKLVQGGQTVTAVKRRKPTKLRIWVKLNFP